jgi:hypothetical protein
MEARTLCGQQSDEVTPGVLVAPDLSVEAVVDPPGATEVPSVEVPVVLATHGLKTLPATGGIVVKVTIGNDTVDGWLTPALSISVAPSGMVPPASEAPGAAPGVKSGDAMPAEDTDALQIPADVPPPSKAAPGEIVVD